jgi:hypothetical protein
MWFTTSAAEIGGELKQRPPDDLTAWPDRQFDRDLTNARRSVS